MSFTFNHALIASLALHGLMVLPFAVAVTPEPPEDVPVLVVELQGVEAETQTEQQLQQQTKGEANPQEAQPPAEPTQAATKAAEQAPSPEQPPEETAESGTHTVTPPPQPEQKEEQAPPQTAKPPSVTQTGNSGAANIEGAAQQQQAQTIAQQQDEAERLRAYLKALTKKVQDNLVYPDAGRKAGLKGTASVSFKLLADGNIGAGSLSIASSSGQPQLDASAMKTVAASAPFNPPPRPITIAITVIYGKLASNAKR